MQNRLRNTFSLFGFCTNQLSLHDVKKSFLLFFHDYLIYIKLQKLKDKLIKFVRSARLIRRRAKRMIFMNKFRL